MSDHYDVLIIGGGPAGATSAMYSARAGLKTLVIDRDIKSGALGMTSKIANFPAVPGEVSGAELVNMIRCQAESFGAIITKNKIVGTDVTQEVKRIYVADGNELTSRTIIIATGAMGRKPSIEGESEFMGKGVSYCATCCATKFSRQSWRALKVASPHCRLINIFAEEKDS